MRRNENYFIPRKISIFFNITLVTLVDPGYTPLSNSNVLMIHMYRAWFLLYILCYRHPLPNNSTPEVKNGHQILD